MLSALRFVAFHHEALSLKYQCHPLHIITTKGTCCSTVYLSLGVPVLQHIANCAISWRGLYLKINKFYFFIIHSNCLQKLKTRIKLMSVIRPKLMSSYENHLKICLSSNRRPASITVYLWPCPYIVHSIYMNHHSTANLGLI